MLHIITQYGIIVLSTNLLKSKEIKQWQEDRNLKKG